MGLCLSSGIYLSCTGFPDILITIPSAVPINHGFSCFVIFEVFVTHCGVVFVKLLNGTDRAENGGFM